MAQFTQLALYTPNKISLDIKHLHDYKQYNCCQLCLKKTGGGRSSRFGMVIVMEQSTGVNLGGGTLESTFLSTEAPELVQLARATLWLLIYRADARDGVRGCLTPNDCYTEWSSPSLVRQRMPLHPSPGSHILMSHWPLWPAQLLYSWLRYPVHTSHIGCTNFRNALFGGTPALGDYRADGQSLLDPSASSPKVEPAFAAFGWHGPHLQ